MPIHCSTKIDPLSADEFEKLDYRIMRHAYASQNELGRLCDESAYQADLKARLLADGFSAVAIETPVTVTHRDFAKQFFLDLIADNALYELKTHSMFVGEHEAQLYNYLFLLDIPRGKLLNFRPSKVQGKILATSLTTEDRRRFTVNIAQWRDLTADCRTLRQTMVELLEDWGAFLDFTLYQEALMHLMGGANVQQLVSLSRNGLHLGTQRMFVHTPEIAFRITAYTENHGSIASHLQRLLSLTTLRAIQWINLNHAQIEFTTIQR